MATADSINPGSITNSNPLPDEVAAFIVSSPGTTARQLVAAFSAMGRTVTKGQINNVLYSHRRQFVTDGGTPPHWHLAEGMIRPPAQRTILPPAAVAHVTLSSRSTTPQSPGHLDHLIREARSHGFVPPTNPKKLSEFASAVDLVALVGLTPGQRKAAAEACQRLHVGGIGVWFAECLDPGKGAKRAVEQNARRRAEKVKSQIAARTPEISATPPSRSRGAKSSSRTRDHEIPSLDWLPDDVPSPGPSRLPTGDGPRTRPQLGIARSGF